MFEDHEVQSVRQYNVTLDRGQRARIGSVDTLRGLVMVIMALDHARDFFSTTGFNPREVTDPLLFLTRWVTHFCAPTFILLAGLSAFLYGRGKSLGELSRFLLVRGLWLILIDLTLINFGWRFEVDLYRLSAGVIFVIGVSMVVLSALIWLPRWALASLTLLMLAGHNLLDNVRAEDLGEASGAWHLLHEPGRQCQTNANRTAKCARRIASGCQVTPLGQRGEAVLLEDVAVVEVAIVVEVIVDRGVDGGEFLQGLDVPEFRHCPFPSSERLV